MNTSDSSSRREFVRAASIATGVLGIAGLALPTVAEAADTGVKPEDALKKLVEGNKRFAAGKASLLARRSPRDFIPLAEGQKPFAVIVGCADSRVAPELLFDQGVGDLFVVRIAGNIVSGAGATVKGSIEYAIAELGARLIVVLGHSQCGAVKAAIEHIEAKDKLPGSIDELINPIRPVVKMVTGKPGDKLANVTKANVLEGVKKLQGLDPILSKLVKKDEVKVVGGTYELSTGLVEFYS